MNESEDQFSKPNHMPTPGIERRLELAYQRLPADCKVIIGLFAALNSSQGITQDFGLPKRLWEIVHFDGGGPLVGQSEEANWLKGLSDGMMLIADHT